MTDAVRAALERIAALHPDTDSSEGMNEWGEAECFRKAQQIADAALAGQAPSDKCGPALAAPTLYDAQSVEALVRAAVEVAVEVCAATTGQHRTIATYVNKADLGNKVLAMADGLGYGA